jgi:hypothetical protein
MHAQNFLNEDSCLYQNAAVWRANPTTTVFGSFACPKRNEAKKTAPNRAKGELGVAKIPTSAIFFALHLHAFTRHEKRLQLTRFRFAL